ncbi:uncharacterized protein I206_107637 [Kwoniella pini CBS 10737]|uniref:Cytochrome P450 n=1 Tax=Kwoniella pini CBS 10737 TaxID=1296096 RepID=A0A1B9HXW5_9TREE|nr:uncharacterized protein I206_05972 [Kwoniella pini CBS 10737]OCF48104.1 hypothetical protein I206_05972 [Kwoniella pini CBS 10737]
MSWINYIPAVPEGYQKYVPHLMVLGGGIVAYYVLSNLFSYLSILRQVKGLPVKHSFFPSYEQGLRARVPHIPFILPVKDYYSRPEWDRFEKPKSDLLAYTCMTQHRAIYWTANPYTAQHIFTKISLFEKACFIPRMKSAAKFGGNIIVAQDGEEHKRHKAVIRGCFGEEIFRNAWDEVENTVEMMLKEENLIDGGIMEDVGGSTIKVTYIVIGKVGFGYEVPWVTPRTERGEEMGFVEAYEIVDRSVLYQFMLPGWLLRILPTKKFRRMGYGQKKFLEYCYAMARSKRAELGALKEAGEKAKAPTDLLGAIVHAQVIAEEESRVKNGSEAPHVGLTEEEVIGNMFIFLLAGHETTGHTIAFTIAQLALNPEWQDECYKEIKAVCGDEKPSYRDVHRLPLCLAVGLEAMRLTDIVRQLFKVAKVDSMLPYNTWDDHGNVTRREHLVKAGSLVYIDTPACQLNPFHWEGANDFNPRRHLSGGDDARAGLNKSEVPFVAFSMGTRQCIGRRFAEVEIISFISSILARYTIHPVPAHKGETKEKMKARMLDSAVEDLTMTPGLFKVRFEKRK